MPLPDGFHALAEGLRPGHLGVLPDAGKSAGINEIGLDETEAPIMGNGTQQRADMFLHSRLRQVEGMPVEIIEIAADDGLALSYL